MSHFNGTFIFVIFYLNKSIVITVLKQQKVCLQVHRAKQTSIDHRSEKVYKTITRSTNFKGLKKMEIRLHYEKLFVL